MPCERARGSMAPLRRTRNHSTGVLREVDTHATCIVTPTQRPLSSSLLGLCYRILNINHKKELLRGLWVNRKILNPNHACDRLTERIPGQPVSQDRDPRKKPSG